MAVTIRVAYGRGFTANAVGSGLAAPIALSATVSRTTATTGGLVAPVGLSASASVVHPPVVIRVAFGQGDSNAGVTSGLAAPVGFSAVATSSTKVGTGGLSAPVSFSPVLVNPVIRVAWGDGWSIQALYAWDGTGWGVDLDPSPAGFLTAPVGFGGAVSPRRVTSGGLSAPVGFSADVAVTPAGTTGGGTGGGAGGGTGGGGTGGGTTPVVLQDIDATIRIEAAARTVRLEKGMLIRQSLGEVELQWGTFVDANGNDLTGLPVSVSLGTGQAPGTWMAPTHLQQPAASSLRFGLLIGGAYQPPVGTYTMWVKIVGTEETIVEPATNAQVQIT